MLNMDIPTFSTLDYVDAMLITIFLIGLGINILKNQVNIVIISCHKILSKKLKKIIEIKINVLNFLWIATKYFRNKHVKFEIERRVLIYQI